MMGYFTSPDVAFGPGAIEQFSGLGIQRALLVVDPVLKDGAAHRRVVEELAKIDASVELFEGVVIGPTRASVEGGVERARAIRPETIIALGGGSTIDTAKAVWVGYARPELPLDGITPLVELKLRSAARFVAIPTTGGSGAEAAWSVRLRGEDGSSTEMSSRELMADWALLDPAFSLTLPPKATAESGAQLLGLALEALASEWSNPFSDSLARAAVVSALPSLPKAVKHPDEVEHRSSLLYSANMAGIAAANSQVGVGHALASALADLFPVSPGRLIAALLPYVVEFNYPVAREKYATLSPMLGLPSSQHRSLLSERLRTTWDLAGLPRTLVLAGLSPEQLASSTKEIVDRAARTPAALGNPRVASTTELSQLLRAASEGSPVSF